jgi:hypothetical protein
MPVFIGHLWQLKTAVFLHRCLIYALLLTRSLVLWPNLVNLGPGKPEIPFLADQDDNSKL